MKFLIPSGKSGWKVCELRSLKIRSVIIIIINFEFFTAPDFRGRLQPLFNQFLGRMPESSSGIRHSSYTPSVPLDVPEVVHSTTTFRGGNSLQEEREREVEEEEVDRRGRRRRRQPEDLDQFRVRREAEREEGGEIEIDGEEEELDEEEDEDQSARLTMGHYAREGCPHEAVQCPVCEHSFCINIIEVSTHKNTTTQHNATQHNTTQHNTTRYNTARHTTTLYTSTTQHNPPQYSAPHNNTPQRTNYNALQHHNTPTLPPHACSRKHKYRNMPISVLNSLNGGDYGDNNCGSNRRSGIAGWKNRSG